MTKGSIPLPNKIYFAKDEGTKSIVVMEPLYRGYGQTVGNALRRVLLSSLPGAAVTAVKIKGVDHEFQPIPNIAEDVVDIILNLKQLRLKLNSEEPVRLTLTAKGQKEVRAGNFKADSRVEIVNTDLIIATLDNKNADLSMEIVVEKGLGYETVEARETGKQEIGMLAIDARFSPVKNVNFVVQNVRVGQITDYDKLTITMETDGTITGREAMDIASQILVDHFALLKTSEAGAEIKPQAEVTEPESIAVPETEPVAGDQSALETLGLSNRAQNALIRNNIRTLEHLRSFDREGLSRLEGLGEKSIEEILKAIGK